MASTHATLSAAADDRKARLAKLRSLKRKQPDEDETASLDAPPPPAQPQDPGAAGTDQAATVDGEPPERDVARLYLSGRNYDPEAKGPKLGFDAPPTLGLERATLEEQAADLAAEVDRQRAEDERADKGIDLFKLQPKRPNWDLKRELAKKMEVLNVRTDNAIAKLVRERLAAKKAAAVQKAGGGGGGGDGGKGEVESAGLDGAELVEGVRLREQEEAEEMRREREQDDLA